MIGGPIGEHVPKNLSKVFITFFLLFLTVSSNVKSLENVLIEKLDMD